MWALFDTKLECAVLNQFHGVTEFKYSVQTCDLDHIIGLYNMVGNGKYLSFYWLAHLKSFSTVMPCTYPLQVKCYVPLFVMEVEVSFKVKTDQLPRNVCASQNNWLQIKIRSTSWLPRCLARSSTLLSLTSTFPFDFLLRVKPCLCSYYLVWTQG